MSFQELEQAAHNNRSIHLTPQSVQLLWRDMIKEMEHAYWRGVQAGEKGARSSLNMPLELRK